ncbi:MAG: hypothetical protein AUJ49_00500 [Desulfovibrionaceae bacterium CG1_02_65_16]|nr:MAG: hypothetical protein AUJ49_00500 [Desulfovibrionaceae bacterium CG1_02_65_16]
MADKKVVLITCGAPAANAAGDAMKKLLKKAATTASFTPAGMVAEAVTIEGAAQTAPEGVAKVFEDGGAYAVVDLGNAGADALEAAVAQISEAVDRRTMVVLAAADGLFFSGLGINTKIGSAPRAAVAADVVATICYVADLPVPPDLTGAVLYQVLKDPDMKLKEIGKLRDALGRMEVALQRDNREPWDKHDCA